MYADICFHCETQPCGYTICVSDLNLSTGTLPPCKENARRHIRPGQANRKWEEVLLRRRQSIPLRSLWVITGLAVSFASASPPASYLSWVGARPRGTMAHKGRSEFRFPSDCVCVSRVLKGKKGRGLFIYSSLCVIFCFWGFHKRFRNDERKHKCWHYAEYRRETLRFESQLVVIFGGPGDW